MVSIKDQRKHIVKLKRLLAKIMECQRTGAHLGLDADEIDTIERALLCHHAVITVDLANRREKKDGH